MIPASDFGDINQIPTTQSEVIWSDLDSDFYDECMQSLNELTNCCTSSSSFPTSFYVGAGISIFRPSKLPDAKMVLKTLFNYCKQTHSPYLDTGVETLLEVIDQGGYVLMENVFQHLYESLHPRQFHSGSIFDVPILTQSFNINHLFLARWLQSGKGTVLTTNLDPLIEQAWLITSPSNKKLYVIKHPTDFDGWRAMISDENVLWKLHGSAGDSETWAITLSKVGFKLEDARANFIDHVVSQHHVCFIGYRAADLDLFPPILAAHTNKPRNLANNTKVFWIFYFRDGYRTSTAGRRTLEDYLAHEPNIRKLYEANPSGFRPIVTTAERLLVWLRLRCLNETSSIPNTRAPTGSYDYSRGLKSDIDNIGFIGAGKLVGFTLRTVGKHEEALKVLDLVIDRVNISSNILDSETIKQIAQLWQESAHTSFQKGNVQEALRKLDRTWKLLKNSDDQLGRAWCQYGRVTMALDAKDDVSVFVRLQALQWLPSLKNWFKQLVNTYPESTSPLLGQGLCLYYQLKIVERILGKLGLLRLSFSRNSLLKGYNDVEQVLHTTAFLNSLPDVLRRKAFLMISVSPGQAVDYMIESMRVAEVVSTEHHRLACERAHTFIEQIKEPSLQQTLQALIAQTCASDRQ